MHTFNRRRLRESFFMCTSILVSPFISLLAKIVLYKIIVEIELTETNIELLAHKQRRKVSAVPY